MNSIAYNGHRIILLIFFAGINLYLAAQQTKEPCGFNTYFERHQKEIGETEESIYKGIGSQTRFGKTSFVKIIPVVVHIIHNGGTENISEAQIQSQIDVLNEDFRKKQGTKGDGTGVDTEIQFCLAKITPDGKCTNGIVRVQSDLTNHQTYQRSLLKQLSYWDNVRYLNIYVVKNINNGSGTLGYASFPGGPADEDGVVVRHDYFGRVGTASASFGRTTTHEISHWFGLYHTFQDGCGTDTCTSGDKVCDTPPVAAPNYSCNTVNSCHNDFPDQNDQLENYMDYTPDNCKSMFTLGQKNRMQATLNTIRAAISSPENLTSTGCDSGYMSPACNVIADFFVNAQTVCSGNQLKYTVRAFNNPTSFKWYFDGGSPASSTLANPEINYSTLGTYPVKLVVYNTVGSDSLTRLGYITVINPPVGIPLPYSEGFEDLNFPSNGISIENNDNGVTWQRDTIAKAFDGKGSAKINNLINTNYGQSDAMILPSFDLSTFSGIPFLNFKWAYAKSDPTYSDELVVAVSKDCGVNWNQIYRKTGDDLATGSTQTTPYIPDSSTLWKTAKINLNAYKVYRNVLIKIINVTDGGNNLYVDYINLGAINAGIEEERNDFVEAVFPNPNNGEFSININNTDLSSVNIKVYDMMGKEINRDALNITLLDKNTLIVKANIASGLYFISISNGNNIATEKISIQQ